MRNALTTQVGMLVACSKLVAMAIYLGKQACGNDKRACVYLAGYLQLLQVLEDMPILSKVEPAILYRL